MELRGPMASVSPRPLGAVVLGLLGGIVPLVGAKIVLDGCAPFFCDGVWLDSGLPLVVACGVAMILGSSAMYVQPARHRTWGAAVLGSSLATLMWFLQLSIFGLVGLILGVIGGGRGGTWRPPPGGGGRPPGQPRA